MNEPEERTGKRRKKKASPSSSGSRSERDNKQSSGSTTITPSSSNPSGASSSTSSDNSKEQIKQSKPAPKAAQHAEEESQSRNQLNLLASASTSIARTGGPVIAEGGSDAGGPDEQDTQDVQHVPQHEERESAQQGQQPPQAPPIPNPVRGVQPAEVEQMVQRILLQTLQSIMSQPSDTNEPPHIILIRQLAQHLANAGNPVIPPQQPPPPLMDPNHLAGRSAAAESFLLQLQSTNGNYQNNSAAALNFTQQLQQLMMQQQLAGSAANPTFNPFANLAALLQQQNQLQLQQNQLSSLMAMNQFANPGLFTGLQDPRSASTFPIAAAAAAAAQNMNPVAAMLNPAAASTATTATTNTTTTTTNTNTNTTNPMLAPPPTATSVAAPATAAAAADISFVIEPTGRPPLPLATDQDAANLAPYQCLLRQQIELFETREDDIYLKAQGRNTPIRVGQVGIRCRHCASMFKSNRVEGSAVLYSKSLNGIYQVALNMGRLHFLSHPSSCPMIPEATKTKLNLLKELPRKVARGRQYWKETLEAQGVVEEQEYLRFQRLPR